MQKNKGKPLCERQKLDELKDAIGTYPDGRMAERGGYWRGYMNLYLVGGGTISITHNTSLYRQAHLKRKPNPLQTSDPRDVARPLEGEN